MTHKTLITLLFMVGLIFTAFADEPQAVQISAETEINPTQLQYEMLTTNIEKALIGMQTVIQRAEEQNVNTTTLNVYMQRLESLNTELIELESFDRTQFGKHQTQATQIVTSFRQSAHELFTTEKRDEIRKQIQERREQQQELQERIQQIREKQQAQNKRALAVVQERLLQQTGDTQTAQRVIQAIRAQNITREQVRELREVVNQRIQEIPTELRKLRQALTDGVITQEEFNERYRNFLQTQNQDQTQQRPSVSNQEPQGDISPELRRLRQALAEGVITQDEFNERYREFMSQQTIESHENSQVTQRTEIRNDTMNKQKVSEQQPTTQQQRPQNQIEDKRR